MLDYHIVYSVFTLVPCWYILNSAWRVYHHHRDGLERQNRKPKCLYFKRILTLVMVLTTLYHLSEVVELQLAGKFTLDQTLLIGVYLSLSTIAWLVSFFMLQFEYRRKLRLRTAGNRVFWVLSSVLYIAVVVSLVQDKQFADDSYLRFVTYSLGTLVSITLGVLSVFRPNEFPIEREYRAATTQLLDHTPLPELPSFSVRISDLKTKFRNNRTVLFFIIRVLFPDASYSVSHSYNDFDKLDKDIRKHFPKETFPYLKFPKFPVFERDEYLDRRKQELENYLNNLISEKAFMCEEFLEFLGVPEPFYQEMLEVHRKVLAEVRHHSIADRRSFSGELEGTYTFSLPDLSEQQAYYCLSLQTYIRISLSSELSTDHTKILYILNWKIGDVSGHTKRAFKQFKTLHTLLKKQVSPAKLPTFPSRSYLHSIFHSHQDIHEPRRVELERYLAHILNDPAFHCNELLKFLECRIPLKKVWTGDKTTYYYLIAGEVTWETDIEGDSFYQVYTVPMIKMMRGQKVSEWMFSRRFSEFFKLHNFLTKRALSPRLGEYLYSQHYRKTNMLEISSLPEFPHRSIIPLVSPAQIEDRREKLEKYLNEVIRLASVRCCYYFKCFICEPANSSLTMDVL